LAVTGGTLVATPKVTIYNVPSTFTLTLSGNDLFIFTNGSLLTQPPPAFVVTLPRLSAANDGSVVILKRSGYAPVTVTAGLGNGIDSDLSGSRVLAVENQSITLVASSNWGTWNVVSSYVPTTTIATAYAISTSNYSM
jgi:hypothetical protein